ncbi:Methyltransferase domain-containing protein [Chitinophaga ginsengisegetis]|uniref:Methyltransferase domain-containing protein n=1 Tax=Chitinophaga ginsengisegetis TaxID=393003 RepID=A0A1T5ND60_9BACT|nr:class I SAM-dependent methyltransferase [Chitinophaga ginsengisegetis]MDR6570598.1 SAM-dependent methyltransferase [Chitinophaga ginsengisegetis]MDR6650332.1 SAM-dependent methyltransferase [Chitinophaga ginsengisegetis]MDR6656549.1 SAM-dependent methyltransferase [Chitinophaga ginsengisegetis]SKC98292.1 Methyltransferase domain-containing protein [Chitinophaga ginsengisegetis]
MEKYFSGEVLHGDDFTLDEIRQWYDDEKEGYAGLVSGYKDYHYGYHRVNQLFGFKYLPEKKFKRVLGIGSAFGHEFKPISSQIESLYILEPSDNLVSDTIGQVKVTYKKPNVDGKIDFPDNYFDLIVCFDTLHHIPNVKNVLREMYRCLEPGGHLLLKEPVNSMGDWRETRQGLTKWERGIPYEYFRKNIPEIGFKVVKKNHFFTMTSFLVRKTEKLLAKPIYEYPFYLFIDKYLSKIFSWNIKYHPVNKWQRISPTEIFYILSK